MAIATDDGTLAVWRDGASGNGELIDTGVAALSDVAVGPDGDIVTVDVEGSLRVWSGVSGVWTEAWRTDDAHLGSASTVAISTDGRTVVTGGVDELVRRWSAADGSSLDDGVDLDEAVVGVAVAPNSSQIAALTAGGRLILIDGADVRPLSASGVSGASIAYADQRRLLVAGADSVVTIDPTGDEVLRGVTPSFDGGVIDVAYRADPGAPGLSVAGGRRTGNGTITVWDPTAPEQAIDVGGVTGDPTAVALGPSGAYLVFADYRETYRQALVNT